jgi:hypothetical protein
MHAVESEEEISTHACKAGKCCSVGDFECMENRDATVAEGGTTQGKACTHVEVSRRWLLMQRHVSVLGLERKLRSEMWQDLVDVARTRSATPSESGEQQNPVFVEAPSEADVSVADPVDTLQSAAEFQAEEPPHAGGRGPVQRASLDARRKVPLPGKNKLSCDGRSSLGNETSSSFYHPSPQAKKSWLGRARDFMGSSAL